MGSSGGPPGLRGSSPQGQQAWLWSTPGLTGSTGDGFKLPVQESGTYVDDSSVDSASDPRLWRGCATVGALRGGRSGTERCHCCRCHCCRCRSCRCRSYRPAVHGSHPAQMVNGETDLAGSLCCKHTDRCRRPRS